MSLVSYWIDFTAGQGLINSNARRGDRSYRYLSSIKRIQGFHHLYDMYVRIEAHGSVVVALQLNGNGVGKISDEKCYRSTCVTGSPIYENREPEDVNHHPDA